MDSRVSIKPSHCQWTSSQCYEADTCRLQNSQYRCIILCTGSCALQTATRVNYMLPVLPKLSLQLKGSAFTYRKRQLALSTALRSSINIFMVGIHPDDQSSTTGNNFLTWGKHTHCNSVAATEVGIWHWWDISTPYDTKTLRIMATPMVCRGYRLVLIMYWAI